MACVLMCGFSFADDDKNCREWSKTAGLIMKARQNNIPLYETLSMIENSYTDYESSEAVEKMALLAYEHPRFSLEEYQSNAVTDFENDIMLVCMKEKM